MTQFRGSNLLFDLTGPHIAINHASKARTSLAPQKAEVLVVINENEDRIDEFKKTRKIDLTEVKQGAFKKVVVKVVDLEEEDDEEDNDEEELFAYLEDLEEREEDEEEVTLNELA